MISQNSVRQTVIDRGLLLSKVGRSLQVQVLDEHRFEYILGLNLF